jgi:hypothetical protein
VNRRGFLGALAGVIGAGVGRTFFDVGASWQKSQEGLYFRKDAFELAMDPLNGDWVTKAYLETLPLEERKRWKKHIVDYDPSREIVKVDLEQQFDAGDFRFTTHEFMPPNEAYIANEQNGKLLARLEFSGPELTPINDERGRGIGVRRGGAMKVTMNSAGVLTLG